MTNQTKTKDLISDKKLKAREIYWKANNAADEAAHVLAAAKLALEAAYVGRSEALRAARVAFETWSNAEPEPLCEQRRPSQLDKILTGLEVNDDGESTDLTSKDFASFVSEKFD